MRKDYPRFPSRVPQTLKTWVTLTNQLQGCQTLAAAKSGGNELEQAVFETRGHAFGGVETVPFRVDKTSCPA